ncbi:MAG TPA: formylmethanofuran dehydrogenase subunit E family protein [Syntrophorhabdales bacterium]|nr:formylmethanofuran dehydrogenase subunit E family protein [Syntrophorhabdales bacterium]
MKGQEDRSHKPKQPDKAVATIRSYTFEEFVDRVRTFHSYPAPGVLIGGFMVDLAYRHLPEDALFDAVVETPKCLPDAVQLLTPCTVGNSWLTVLNLGRYAVTFYDKRSGEGIRVFVDPVKLESWPEIKNWFFKLKPKKEQDDQLLLRQIKEAGASFCSVQQVRVAGHMLEKRHRAGFAVCPRCKESYPVSDGEFCLACQDTSPYLVE